LSVLFRIVALSCVLALPTVAQANCASPEQVKAAQLRQLHYQLQVAALNCRGDYPDLPGKWQSYIHHHGGTLRDNARTLQGYFKSVAAFDRHNTKVTNRESVRVHDHPDYCGMTDPIFDKVVTLGPQQLAAYASELIGPPSGVPACPVKTVNKGDGAKPPQKTKKKPAAE
jgi:hypothetical protein